MRDELRQHLGSVGWRDIIVGAVVGLFITAALQPFVLSFATDVYVDLGAPGHQPPSLDVNYRNSAVSYPNGTEVDTFDGLKWNSEYRTYRVSVENTGNKPARDLEIDIPLPGCGVYINSDGPAVGGEYQTEGLLRARITGSDVTAEKVHKCSYTVSSERLYPGEGLAVEFVTTTDFERCDLLAGVHARPEIIVEYRWEKSSSSYKETDFREFPEMEEAYNQLYRDNNGQGARILSQHNRWYLAFIIGDFENFDQAKEQCGYSIGEMR